MKIINKVIFLIFSVILISCNPSGKQDARGAESPSDASSEWVAGNSEAALKIDRYLSAMEVQGFSGAIVVKNGETVILRKGYGFADRELRKPYTQETIQTNGSITKQFTGAAILLLESRGELSVDDKISDYLEPLSEKMQGITIHQLLTHSSGMPGGIGADDEPVGAEAYLERLRAESLQFEPGLRYAYSNTGYSLLGMIVEKVSGQSYESFLRKELFLPAGMNNTGYILPDWDREKMAIGYRNGERWGEVYNRGWLEEGPNWHLRANGGMHTTVGDMAAWLKTVQGLGVLGEDAARRWTTGYVTESGGISEYGYGWSVYNHDKWGKVITHGGSNQIFEADFVWLPERDFFFYIQSNNSLVPAIRQSANIINAAFDSSFVMPPLPEAIESADPELATRRAGTYFLNDGNIELMADDTRLIAKITGQSLLDQMFGHSDQQKTRFAELNARTRVAMDKLQAGEQDAMSELVSEETDAAAATAPFLQRINQIGKLDSLHVIGTFVNESVGRFARSGPWTTFVYAEFENWNQYWNLVWNKDETYAENLQGPWPSFTLIPAGKNSYTGIGETGGLRTVDLEFKKDCLKIGEEMACKENNSR
jgi:CubicO group peptidase (beta-lactamase class C family)